MNDTVPFPRVLDQYIFLGDTSMLRFVLETNSLIKVAVRIVFLFYVPLG